MIDLRQRFDSILDQLESVAGWETARINRPVLILGSLDGIETGIRQLRRSKPLETTLLHVGEDEIRLPTLPEALRIKAFLCLDRNATRDYLDVAALAGHLGDDAACEALATMDDLYPQKNGNAWAVRTQLIKQLADPRPYDLNGVDLAEYKGVRPPYDRWEQVAAACSALSASLIHAFLPAPVQDSTAESSMTRANIELWLAARSSGDTPPLEKLPGLKT